MSKIEIDELSLAGASVEKLMADYYSAQVEETPSIAATFVLEQTMERESAAMDTDVTSETPTGQHDSLKEVINSQPALSTLVAATIPMVATNQLVSQAGPRGGVDMNTARDSNKTADGQSDAPSAGEAANPTASADQSNRGSAG